MIDKRCSVLSPIWRHSQNPATRVPLQFLKEEARFYLLPGLERMCTGGPSPLFVVTEFYCDSRSKCSHVEVTNFVVWYETARAEYNKRAQSYSNMVLEKWQEQQGDYYSYSPNVDDDKVAWRSSRYMVRWKLETAASTWVKNLVEQRRQWLLFTGACFARSP